MKLFGKKSTGLDTLLPIIIGGVVGVIGYSLYMQKEFEQKLALAKEQAMQQSQVSESDIISSGLRWNTTPYIERSSTTEWNPENLKLSGSISDAGYGYVFAVPRSPI